uniref:Putative esophageal gland cell secretory protein 26 n=1 Tax=Meloidogyne incognita TaxID=6306 RepID=Q7YWF6_MELIC|nr:putative esophageal gland cell secretory protein 26 [Meloidogyne incognita]
MFYLFYFKLFLFSLISLNKVNGFCMKTICSADTDSRHPVNRVIGIGSDGISGEYKALRRNDQIVEAVDLSCREGSFVYSPFEGEISAWRPFDGNGQDEIRTDENKKNTDGCRPDRGVRIDGKGQWQGYHVLIGSVRLFRYSGHVNAGQKIGVSLDIECELKLNKQKMNKRPRKEENFVRVYLHKEGRPIDPTHHLIDCMCINQVCETNRINALEGPLFKFDSRFNGVRGWEIKCPDIQQIEEENSSEEEEEKKKEENNLNEEWGTPKFIHL